MNDERSRIDLYCDAAAWVLAGAALIAVLKLHLLPALMIGFLVYELIHVIVPLLEKKLPRPKGARNGSGHPGYGCGRNYIRLDCRRYRTDSQRRRQYPHPSSKDGRDHR